MELLFALVVACGLAALTQQLATSDTNTTTVNTTILEAATAVTKPECQSQCGNLTVPYPFGIGVGKGCSIDNSTWFDINCDTSFNPPKAFIGNGNIQVYDISSTQLRISNVMAKKCYNQSGSLTQDFTAYTNLLGSPYTFSDANAFTVVGCDDYAYISGSEQGNYTSGCVSLCSNPGDVPSHECSGIGCSQVSVKDLKYYHASLASLRKHTTISWFDPCSYAFLGEKARFKFGGASDFSDPSFENRTLASVPIVLDWVIGNQTCAQAQQQDSIANFACKSANSFCINSNSSFGGYRCSCIQGYEGNPYLSSGCRGNYYPLVYQTQKESHLPFSTQKKISTNVMIQAKMIARRTTATILQGVTAVLVHMDSMAMARKIAVVVLLKTQTSQ